MIRPVEAQARGHPERSSAVVRRGAERSEGPRRVASDIDTRATTYFGCARNDRDQRSLHLMLRPFIVFPTRHHALHELVRLRSALTTAPGQNFAHHD